MSSPNIPEMRRRPDSRRSHSRNENVLRLEPLPFPALFLLVPRTDWLLGANVPCLIPLRSETGPNAFTHLIACSINIFRLMRIEGGSQMSCSPSHRVRLLADSCIPTANRTNEIKLLASADCLAQAAPSRTGIKPKLRGRVQRAKRRETFWFRFL